MKLFGILAEIADVAGVDAAIAIANAVGGLEVYIPSAPTNDHWMCRLIGREEARAVCDRLTCGLAGRRIEMPRGPMGEQAKRRALLDSMLGEDRSDRDIAYRTGYTVGAVRKRRRKLNIRRNDGQLSLF